MLVGVLYQIATVGRYVALFEFVVLGGGVGNSLESFLVSSAHPLVGFPGFLVTLLGNVVRSARVLSVGQSPSGDPLVHGVGVIASAALGQFGFPIEDIDSVVMAGVLLSGVVPDGPAVVGVVAEGEFESLAIHGLW